MGAQYISADDDEINPKSSLMTWSDVEAIIPASSSEIHRFSNEHSVVEIDGFVRQMSAQAVEAMVVNLCDALIENGWPTSAVDELQCAAVIDNVDSIMLRHVLHSFTEAPSSSSSAIFSKNATAKANEKPVWSLDPNKMAKAIAHHLFKTAESKVSIEESTASVLLNVVDVVRERVRCGLAMTSSPRGPAGVSTIPPLNTLSI